MKLKKDKSVKMVLDKTFPEYTGRRIFLDTKGKVYFHDLNWGGGTRNYYKAITLDENLTTQSLPEYAPWNNPIEGKSADIPKGIAIIIHQYFCGHESISICINPHDMPKWITN